MVWVTFSNMDLYFVFQYFLGTICIFSSSTYFFMERALFLLELMRLSRHGKMFCGRASKLRCCQSPCMAGLTWREALRLSPKDYSTWPFLFWWIPALNNSFLGMNWTWASYSSHVSVRLHIYSAFWWDAQRPWAQFCRIMATAAIICS